MTKFFFTAKFPLRLIAILIIVFLVGATTLYFFDTIVGGFDKLSYHGAPLVPPSSAEHLALLMSITIGLGVFAESASTIWDKMVFWGQAIDNKVIKLVYDKEFFLDTAFKLLEKTRLLFNQTNFNLQAIAIPTDSISGDEEELDALSDKIKTIKNNCQKIHIILEENQAKDAINKQKQNAVKQQLNLLVSANLEMSAWLETLSQAAKKNL